MTLLQFVKEECANYETDGGCRGADIAADGRSIALWSRKPPRCVLADGQSCRYFEECVLAGIPAMRDERKAEQWQQAADEYAADREREKHEHERKQQLGLDAGSLVGIGTLRTAGHQEAPGAAITNGSRYAHAPSASRNLRRVDRRTSQLAQVAANRRTGRQRQWTNR
jgi:hypothetical protein